jgi:hypothetical protein
MSPEELNRELTDLVTRTRRLLDNLSRAEAEEQEPDLLPTDQPPRPRPQPRQAA